MVTVIQNGRKIEVPQDVWETLKQWPDLASAPKSVQNLARAHGIEVPRIVVEKETETYEVPPEQQIIEMKEEIEARGYDFSRGVSTEEGYVFPLKGEERIKRVFEPSQAYQPKADYLVVSTTPEKEFVRPDVRVQLPTEETEQMKEATAERLKYEHVTTKPFEPSTPYTSYLRMIEPFAPSKKEHGIVQFAKGAVYGVASLPLIPFEAIRFRMEKIPKPKVIRYEFVKDPFGFSKKAIMFTGATAVSVGKGYAEYITKYPAHAVGGFVALAALPMPKFVPKVKLPKIFSRLSVAVKQKLKLPTVYEVTRLKGVVSGIKGAKTKFGTYIKAEKIPITYTVKEMWKKIPKPEPYSFRAKLAEWKQIYLKDMIYAEKYYVWYPVKSSLKKIVWKTSENIKKTPFKFTKTEPKPISASALARSKIFAMGKKAYRTPTKTGVLKVVGKTTTKTKPKFFEPIISAEPVYPTYTVSPTVAASVLGVRPSELSATTEKPTLEFKTGVKPIAKQLLKMREKVRASEKITNVLKPRTSLKVASVLTSITKPKTAMREKAATKEKEITRMREKTKLLTTPRAPALFKLSSAYFGNKKRAAARVKKTKIKIKIRTKKPDYTSLFGTKKWKGKYTGLTDLIFSVARGKKKIEPAARKLKIKLGVMKRGKKKKKKASLLDIIR